MNQNQNVPPTPEAPAITCPACEVASTIKDVEEVKLWFDLVKKALDKDTNVQIFLSRKKQNLKG
jgi:hypothetical protein